jgi:hypothetical protein
VFGASVHVAPVRKVYRARKERTATQLLTGPREFPAIATHATPPELSGSTTFEINKMRLLQCLFLCSNSSQRNNRSIRESNFTTPPFAILPIGVIEKSEPSAHCFAALEFSPVYTLPAGASVEGRRLRLIRSAPAPATSMKPMAIPCW